MVPGAMRPEPCHSLFDSVLGPEGAYGVVLEARVETLDTDTPDWRRCTILPRAVRIIRAREQELR